MNSQILAIELNLIILILSINCASLGPEYDRISNKWYTHIYETYVNGMDMSEYNAYASISLLSNGYFRYNYYYGTNHSITGSYIIRDDSLFIFTEQCKNSYETYKYLIEDETLKLEYLSSECDKSLNVKLSRTWSVRRPKSWPNNAL
jgi:hypothetical protein